MSIYKTAVWMTIAIVISKLFGLVREIFFANYFGATNISDAYFMAISIVSIVGGGIFDTVSTSYMPVYSALIEKKGEKTAGYFTNNLINILIVSSGLLCILGMIFASGIVNVFARGFEGERYQLTVYFIRIIFLSILMISIMDVFNAYLQYHGRFIAVTLVGFAFNSTLFMGMLVSAWYSKYFLAWGLVVAYMIQLTVTYLVARKRGYSYSFILNFRDPNIKKVVTIAMPIFIATFAGQINAFVDKMLASGLPEGSVAALNYGIQITMVVYAVMTMAITTIVYPMFSKKAAVDDMMGMEKSVVRAINLVIIILVPVSIGLMMLRIPMIEVVYERGVFDKTATQMTTSVLLFFNIGMVGMGIRDVLAKAMFSVSDTKTPMINGVLCMIINIMLNLLLIKTMGIKGLALSSAVAYNASALILMGAFYKRSKTTELGKVMPMLIKTAGAGSIMAFTLYVLNGFYANYATNLISKIIGLIVMVIIGAGIYFAGLMVLRVEEVTVFKNEILSKTRR